jgi:hypothetical protein
VRGAAAAGNGVSGAGGPGRGAGVHRVLRLGQLQDRAAGAADHRRGGAERRRGRGSGRVELQAYADRSGRSNRNQSLSERRAEAVAAELARLGVRRERIAVRAHGESRPFVPTRDEVREAQNRGVWIVLR